VIVATIGIPRSGTTWMYNLVLTLAGHHRATLVDGYFIDVGDRLETLMANSDERTLVVKTHVGSPDFWQTMPSDAHFFITTRDVRDGIASSRVMFPFVQFEQAIAYSRVAADFSFQAAEHGNALVFRYEDKFFEKLSTVTAVANQLGIPLSSEHAQTILDQLSRKKIIETIRKLQEDGIIGGDDDAASHDPLTQWHPGHVKDGRIGKYRDILSEEESALINESFEDYMRHFYAKMSTV